MTEDPTTRRPPDPANRYASALPERVHRLLVWARQQELVATGPGRRRAFYFTRSVIGGIHDAGYPRELVAVALGVSPETVKDRTLSGATLPAEWVRQGAGLGPDALDRWEADGTVAHAVGRGPFSSYPARWVIEALATVPD